MSIQVFGLPVSRGVAIGRAVLVASMLWFPLRGGQASWHEFLIALFLFLTAPVTGNMIAKANLHLGGPAKVPPPPKGDWATFSDREEP